MHERQYWRTRKGKRCSVTLWLGPPYIYDGSNWIKISEFESMDMIIDWTDIQNKPNIVDIKVSATEPTGQIEGDIWIQETV